MIILHRGAWLKIYQNDLHEWIKKFYSSYDYEYIIMNIK